MGFIKTLEEIKVNSPEIADFYDAQMLAVFWETKPEIVARLLPQPLTPAPEPIALAFVAYYPATNFDVTYYESALFLQALYDGREGNYCLSMPVTDDTAMAAGREILGFPKKIARVHFAADGDRAEGWTERRGVRFMQINATLNGFTNDPEAQEKLLSAVDSDGCVRSLSYNFKHFPAPQGGDFNYNPRLVSQETVMRPKEIRFGEAQIAFQHSEYDPLYEVEVVKTLGAVYSRGDNSMMTGKVETEVDAESFAPYAFLKWDFEPPLIP